MFDVGGVLVDYNDAVHFANIAIKVHRETETFCTKAAELTTLLELRKTTISNAERELASVFALKPKDVRGVWRHENKKPIPVRGEMIGLVRKLSAKGFKIVITSNMSVNDYRTLFGREGLLHKLRRYPIFASCYIGLAKPNPRYYEYVLNRMQADPGTSVLIDDLTSNVLGAKSIGITAVHYSNYDELETELWRLGILPNGTDRTAENSSTKNQEVHL
jgi:HAD superfamily hydrolase (TIGR01509 family)